MSEIISSEEQNPNIESFLDLRDPENFIHALEEIESGRNVNIRLGDRNSPGGFALGFAAGMGVKVNCFIEPDTNSRMVWGAGITDNNVELYGIVDGQIKNLVTNKGDCKFLFPPIEEEENTIYGSMPLFKEDEDKDRVEPQHTQKEYEDYFKAVLEKAKPMRRLADPHVPTTNLIGNLFLGIWRSHLLSVFFKAWGVGSSSRTELDRPQIENLGSSVGYPIDINELTMSVQIVLIGTWECTGAALEAGYGVAKGKKTFILVGAEPEQRAISTWQIVQERRPDLVTISRYNKLEKDGVETTVQYLNSQTE